MWIYFLLFLTGFILVHFCKMMRLYLVLMEHGISFSRFVVMYLETTLVNLIVPFKIGEIFRVLVISKETKHWQVGILSVITDRFFDTLALCAILIPVDIWYLGRLSPITWIFLAILFIIVICYVSLMPTYGYLNRYIIMRKNSPRSMAALRGLDGSVERLVLPLMDEMKDVIAMIEVNIDYPEYEDEKQMSNEVIKPYVEKWIKQFNEI